MIYHLRWKTNKRLLTNIKRWLNFNHLFFSKNQKMRKPKTVKEIKNNKYYKEANKEKKKLIRENQTLKIKDYTKVTKIETKATEKISKDWLSTQSKFKGKTKKQITRLTNNYKKRKSNIKKEVSQQVTVILKLDYKELRFEHKENFFTNERFYTINRFSPQQAINKLILENIDKNVEYFLVILEGVDTTTGAKLYVSDSYTKLNIVDLDINEFISLMQNRSSGSGSNFKLKRIVVRVIYENSSSTKRNAAKRNS